MTRETVAVFSASNGAEPSSGSTRRIILTRGLSLIVMPVSRTCVSVPTPRLPVAIRLAARSIFFFLPNIRSPFLVRRANWIVARSLQRFATA